MPKIILAYPDRRVSKFGGSFVDAASSSGSDFMSWLSVSFLR